MFDEPSLQLDGFCIFRQALNPSQVNTAKSLLWNHIEGVHIGVSRDRRETWDDLRDNPTGFLDYSHQCSGTWYVRACPRVKEAFEQVWNTSNLVTSMDTAIAWAPWTKSEYPLRTEGLHLDQTHSAFDTVQGMVVLYDVTKDTGGLEVVPGSHLKFDEISDKVPANWKKAYWDGNWGPLPPNVFPSGSGKLVEAKAGDLILWDSRTIHGGIRGEGGGDPDELARLAVTVCMQPRRYLTSAIAKLRKEGFKKGWGFNHHPTDPVFTAGSPIDYVPIKLTQEQMKLL